MQSVYGTGSRQCLLPSPAELPHPTRHTRRNHVSLVASARARPPQSANSHVLFCQTLLPSTKFMSWKQSLLFAPGASINHLTKSGWSLADFYTRHDFLNNLPCLYFLSLPVLLHSAVYAQPVNTSLSRGNVVDLHILRHRPQIQ